MESTFDPTAIVALVGDEQVARELAGLFLEESPRRLAEARAALRRADADGLRLAAHTLAGSLGLFDAAAAYEAARRLETMGRSADLTAAAEAYSVLERTVGPTRSTRRTSPSPAAGACCSSTRSWTR